MAPELDIDRRAFPAVPPADLDDPQTIIEHDWNAFAAIDRMTDHWSRPGWAAGQRAYYWMLTFPKSPSLISRALGCQEQLEHLGMDPVPEDGLHVTMNRVGGIAQVPRARIQHLVNLAEQIRIDRFQVAAHPLAGSRGAVRFTLSPWRRLVALHAALGMIGSEAGVPGGKPTSEFRPHLGLQYNNRDRPTGPVIKEVARLRRLPPVALDITMVDLVELRREGPAYRWDVVHRIHLRPQSALPGQEPICHT
ncbi:2'-5' RNA ligase family protein [Streptomyces sp. NPDC101062]|uniref:2'-5' RNA ligase family protein n=1 Tax=unclassified Streptomyces TaxID=2593676 RepID=UPI00380306E0